MRAGREGASPSPTVDLGSSAGSVEEQTVAWKAFGNEGKKPLRLGLIIGIGNDPDAAMAKVHELGLPTCQAYCEEFPPGLAEKLTTALGKYGIEATSIVVGGPGKEVWDFYERAADDWACAAGYAGGADCAYQEGVGLCEGVRRGGGADALRIYSGESE